VQGFSTRTVVSLRRPVLHSSAFGCINISADLNIYNKHQSTAPSNWIGGAALTRLAMIIALS
jgi:hypothetical protein